MIVRNKNGSVEISEIVDGHLVRVNYYGYTVREAKEIFERTVMKPTEEK